MTLADFLQQLASNSTMLEEFNNDDNRARQMMTDAQLAPEVQNVMLQGNVSAIFMALAKEAEKAAPGRKLNLMAGPPIQGG